MVQKNGPKFGLKSTKKMKNEIRFSCKKSKKRSDGKSPVEMSVNVNGKTVTVTLPIKCVAEKFERERKKDVVKKTIDFYESKARMILLKDFENTMSAVTFKNLFAGKKEELQYTIKNCVNDFLEECRNNKMSYASYSKYLRIGNKIKEFFGEDSNITNVEQTQCENFKNFLVKNYESATAAKYLSITRAFFHLANRRNKLNINYFEDFSIKKEKKDISIISDDDYQKILKKDFKIERVNHVRELFILTCCTGLSFSDLLSITKKDIIENDGKYFVHGKRHKTGVNYFAVVLPEGVEIMRKYEFELKKLAISNQKCNSYLKEIQDILNITSVPSLHHHLARHYYITRLLRAGLPVEIVQRCAGHSSIVMTAHYTHLIGNDVINSVNKFL